MQGMFLSDKLPVIKTAPLPLYQILILKINLEPTGMYRGQEPITRSLHMCCTLESTLSSEELFIEQAFRRKSIVFEDVNFPRRFPHCCQNFFRTQKMYMWMSMTELRTDWLIGYYALRRDKFCAKTISINNFSSERALRACMGDEGSG